MLGTFVRNLSKKEFLKTKIYVEFLACKLIYYLYKKIVNNNRLKMSFDKYIL